MYCNPGFKRTRRSVRVSVLSLAFLISTYCVAQQAPDSAPTPPPTVPAPITEPAATSHPAENPSPAPTPAPSPSSTPPQTSAPASPTILPPIQECTFTTPGRCAAQIARDQTNILTSPFHLRKKDLLWIAPLGAATGLAFAFDQEALSHVSTDPGRVAAFRRASNLTGLYVPIATIGGAWLTGTIKHDDHLRDTGFVAGEALINTLIFTEFLKFGTDRARPKTNGAAVEPAEAGDFWPDGKHYSGGDSFPSGHSAIAFAFAHVLADEYPGWKIKLAAYGLAAATAFERVGGREHFPSDVLVGGAIGYLIGGYTYNRHSASRNHLTVTPLLGPKTAGVSLTFSRSAESSSDDTTATH